jgi:hypothetical protein
MTSDQMTMTTSRPETETSTRAELAVSIKIKAKNTKPHNKRITITINPWVRFVLLLRVQYYSAASYSCNT